MIDWNVASAVSDIIAAIAVIVTLLYLAKQIRDGRNENQIGSISTATDALNSVFLEIAINSEAARIFNTGLECPSELPKEELARFATLFSIIVGRYGEVYYRWESGALPSDYWEGCLFNLKGLLNSPGGQFWIKTGALNTTAKNYRALIQRITT